MDGIEDIVAATLEGVADQAANGGKRRWRWIGLALLAGAGIMLFLLW